MAGKTQGWNTYFFLSCVKLIAFFGAMRSSVYDGSFGSLHCVEWVANLCLVFY